MKKKKDIERQNTGLQVCGCCREELAGPNLSASNVVCIGDKSWHPRCARMVRRFIALLRGIN